MAYGKTVIGSRMLSAFYAGIVINTSHGLFSDLLKSGLTDFVESQSRDLSYPISF